MWTIAICDDNIRELNVIETLLQKYSEESGMALSIHTFLNGSQLLSACQDNGQRFDLILLDVLMDETDGITTAEKLRRSGIHTPIIFCTTTRDYAMESYEVEADGYLIKPLIYEN